MNSSDNLKASIKRENDRLIVTIEGFKRGDVESVSSEISSSFNHTARKFPKQSILRQLQEELDEKKSLLEHKKSLHSKKTKRLYKLKEKKAKYGINCPVEIEVEIDDIEVSVEPLHQEIEILQKKVIPDLTARIASESRNSFNDDRP